MNLNLREYLEAFVQDAEELLQDLDDTLLVLESDPHNADTINKLFRIAHTLKGNSGMMGFASIKAYTHALESVISLLRAGDRQLDGEISDLLFTAFGFLRETIQHLKLNGEENADDLTSRTRWIKDFLGRSKRGTAQESVQQPVEEPEHDRHANSLDLGDTIRVDVGKLDLLLNSIGELVVNRTRALELIEKHNAVHPDISGTHFQPIVETLQQQGRILSSIQETVMMARMIPIQSLFERCPRVARGLAKALGKKIAVEVSGSATELDKKMIDALSDPLLHLINNAVDHGIESPKIRRAQGKSETGSIRLSAHSEHNQVVVTVADDGRGVDLARLKKKLAALPMGERPNVDKFSPAELLEVLSKPGLSLADRITDVSGRGVGLDVVRSRVEEVNGSLEMRSVPGKGTEFLIRLPLTLAIIQSVLVRYRRTVFAVPLGFVSEVIHRNDGIIRDVKGRGTIVEVRGEVLSLAPLDAALDFEQGSSDDWSYLLIVGIPKRRVAIPVKELIGDQEVVVRTLNPLLGVSRYVSGASVLGNGEVVLILDVFSLFKLQAFDRASPAAPSSGRVKFPL